MLQPPISLHRAKLKRVYCLSSWLLGLTLALATGIIVLVVKAKDWIVEKPYWQGGNTMAAPMIAILVCTIFLGSFWLIVFIVWSMNVCKPCWECTDRNAFELLENDELVVLARWSYTDEEWLEFAEKVIGERSRVPRQRVYSCCCGLCGRHTKHKQMLQQKGEAILGHGFIYFCGDLHTDFRLGKSGLQFSAVEVYHVPDSELNLLRFDIQRNPSIYIPIPKSISAQSALAIAKTVIVPSLTVDEITGKSRRTEREKQQLAVLTQKMAVLHPPAQRDVCRTALIAQIRERYLLFADLLLLLVVLLANLLDSEHTSSAQLTILQCIPSGLGLLSFAMVLGTPLGHQLGHLCYFILNVTGLVCSMVVFGFMLSNFVNVAMEEGEECENRGLSGWGPLSTASLLLVIVLWELPFRISATHTAFVLARPWKNVIAFDAKLSHPPHHKCLESVHTCWMKFIQACYMPTCLKTKEHHEMHAMQHVMQLVCELVTLIVCTVTKSWLALLAIGCGLLGASLGLAHRYYLDVMFNFLAICFSFLVMVFEISKMQCEEFEIADSLKQALYLFVIAVMADCVRISNVLKAYMESEHVHWKKTALLYVNAQNFGDGPDVPYMSLVDPGVDDDSSGGRGTMTEGYENKSSGPFHPPSRQRSLGSIMDSIGAPPPSEASSAASSPSRRSRVGSSEGVAASSSASSPSSRPFSVLQDNAEADNFVSLSGLPASTNAPPPSLASSSSPELSVSGFYPALEASPHRPRKPSMLAIPHATQAPPPSPQTPSYDIDSPDYSRSSAQLDQDQAARAPGLSCYSSSSQGLRNHLAKTSAPPPSPASTLLGGLPHVPSFPLIFRDASSMSLSSSPSMRQMSTAAPPSSPQTSSPSTVSRDLVSFSYVAPALTAPGSPIARTMSIDVTPPTSTTAPPPSPCSSSS